MSECFPVCPTILVQSPQGPIRGHHEHPQDDSDDEPDSSVPTSKPSTAPTSPPLLIQVFSFQFVHHTLILFIILYVPLHQLGMLLQCQRILFHLLQVLFQIANSSIQLWSLPLWSLPEDLVAFVKPQFGTAKTGTSSRDC